MVHIFTCPICKTTTDYDALAKARPDEPVLDASKNRFKSGSWWDQLEQRGSCHLCAAHRDNGAGTYHACPDLACDICPEGTTGGEPFHFDEHGDCHCSD